MIVSQCREDAGAPPVLVSAPASAISVRYHKTSKCQPAYAAENPSMKTDSDAPTKARAPDYEGRCACPSQYHSFRPFLMVYTDCRAPRQADTGAGEIALTR